MHEPAHTQETLSHYRLEAVQLLPEGSWLPDDLVDQKMSCFAAASGKRGRSPKFSDAAIQFCLTLKNLFGLALRQATGLVQSVLDLSGLVWPVPDFSTLCRRQLSLDVQVPYRRSQAGLQLLVDSTGIKFLGEGE